MPSVVTRDFNELDNPRGQIRLMRAARGLRGWKAAAEHPFLVSSHEARECKICGYQLSHVVVVRPPISDTEKGVPSPFHPDLAGRFIAGLEAVPRGHFGEGARAAAAV